MRVVTLNKAISDLQHIIAETISNQEETHIATDEGTVVLIDQENYNSLLETVWLLKDKKSLEALLSGHKERAKGNKPRGKTIEEIFTDV